MGIEIFLLPMGLFIATISSMVGLGGGVFFVPLLVLFFGLPAQNAVGISVLAMTFTTISATISYARQKKINYKIGLLLDVLDVPGAVIGAHLTTFVDSKWLAGLFGFFILFVSICILSEIVYTSVCAFVNNAASIIKKLIGKTGKPLPILTYMKWRPFGLILQTLKKYNKSGLPTRVIYISLATSFVSGLVAGMFGACGGTVDETVMILALNMPIHTASATSVFGMTLTNTAAALSHLRLGNILLNYAIPLIIGAVCGAQIGPLLSKRVGEEKVKKILVVALIIISLRMIFEIF